MGKLSMHPSDSYRGGFMVPEGMAEIVDVKAIVHQYPPNRDTGEQSDPATYLSVEFQPLNGSGDPQGETIAQLYKMGKVEQVLPTNASDDGPVDPEPGEEGGSFWALDEGWKPNNRTQSVQFTDSLIQCGFNEDKLRSGELAEMVGTVGEVKYLHNEATIAGRKSQWTVPIMGKITSFPYDQGGKKSAAKAAAPAAASKKSADPGVSAEDVLAGVLADADSANLTVQGLRKEMLSKALGSGVKLPAARKMVQQLSDSAWLEAQGAELGFSVDGDKLTIG